MSVDQSTVVADPPPAAAGIDQASVVPDTGDSKAPGGPQSPAPISSPSADHWGPLFQGVDALKGPQWDALDKTSKEPKQARAQAVTGSYMEDQGIPRSLIQSNYASTALAFAQEKFGYVGKSIKPLEVYVLIQKKMQEDAEALTDPAKHPWNWLAAKVNDLEARGLGKVLPAATAEIQWNDHISKLTLEALPEADLSKLPKASLPFMPGMPGMSPWIMGAAWNIWRPTLVGAISPNNVAAMAAGFGLEKTGGTVAESLMMRMTGAFTGIMAKAAKDGAENIAKIQKDPNHTEWDLAKAYASEAGNVFLGTLTALHLVTSGETPFVKPAEIEGKTPKEAAEVLHAKAAETEIPEHAAVIEHAAEQLDELGGSDRGPEEWEGVTARPTASEDSASDTDDPLSADSDTPTKERQPITPQDAQHETSLKNAVAEVERAGYGMEVATPADARAMAPRWIAAGETLKKDPEAGARLAAKLKENPNLGLTDDESALLLRHKVKLEAGLNEANDILNDTEASPELKAEAQRQAKDLSQSLLDFMDAVHARGSEWGREGRWRQAMAKEDYSFSAQENLWRQAKGGGELTDDERADLNDKLTELRQKQDALKQRIIELSTPAGHAEAMDAALKDMASPPKRGRVVRTAESIGSKLHARAEKSRAFLSGKLLSASPEDLYHMAVMAADHIYSNGLDFAKWSASMVKDFGDKIKPHLDEAWKAGQKLFNKENREGLVEKLSARLGEDKDADIGSTAQELARGFISDGIKDRDKLVDAVHSELEKAVPGISRRDAMDAISGYGKFKQLTHDEVTDQLRDIKGQLQQVAKLEDMAAGQAPAKTGVERRSPSDTERGLIKQVEEKKKSGGFTVTDPAKQLKTALDTIKTRLGNQIKDFESQIERRQKLIKTKTASPSDGEVVRLTAERDRLKREFDQIFGGDKQKEQQQRQTEALQKKIDALKAKIAAGDTSTAPGKASRPAPPHLEPLKQELEGLRKQMDDLRGPKQLTDEQRLNLAKNRMMARQLELEEKLRNGDFSTKPQRPPVAADKELNQMRSDVERAKQEIQIGREKIAESRKGKFQKAADQISGGAKAFVLTGYHTLGKLAGFSLAKLAEMPFTEGLGAIIKNTPGFRDIASRASMEAGKESQALGQFYAAWATKGVREAADIFRTGKGSMQAELGNRVENARPVKWYDFPGLVHKFEKAPLLTADTELRIAKLTAWSDANGLDVTDPMVQAAIRKEAYDYGQRAILQDKNTLADAINGYVKRLEAEDPKTGRANSGRVALAAMIKTFVTKGIVKTPLNHIAQSLEASPFGLKKGLVDAAMAGRLMKSQGVKALTTAEANTIIRLMKVGGVGTAMYVWGAIDATKKPEDRAFGGFYNPGEKRDEKDAKWGRVRIDGHNLVLPIPILTSAQMGSTMMRVALMKVRQKGSETKGVLAGAVASVLGLADAAPVVGPINQSFTDLQRGQPQKLVWDEIAGLVPQLVQNVAQDTDGKARSPQSMTDAVKAGIPVLREQVPETKAQQKKDGHAPAKPKTKAQSIIQSRIESLQKLKESLPP